ncbi:MAG: hypothetical protein STSR0008_04940 [Ignavibacterium sp.]
MFKYKVNFLKLKLKKDELIAILIMNFEFQILNKILILNSKNKNIGIVRKIHYFCINN